MYRQYSSRNQRNRGIKVKHVLQICLFLAICFWLLYQMKHSHDKNNEFEEDDARGSVERGSIGGYIKIGRKDIRPLYDENKPYNETTEEGIGEELENNHEEDMSLDKNAEEENESSRYEDVVEKFDTEFDQEEDKASDEAIEDATDGEAEGETSDDGNGRKQENSDKSNHEAREEIYEADDGSSAVPHVKFIQTAESKKEVVGISDQHQNNILDLEIRDTHSEEAKNVEISEDNPSSAINVTTGSSEKGSSQNNTLTEAPKNNLEASSITTDVASQNPELFEQIVRKSVPEFDHDLGIVSEGNSMEGSKFKIISLHQNNSTLTVENHLQESNPTGHTEPQNSEDFEDFLKPYNDTDSSTLVRMSRSEHSLEDETNTQKNETASPISDSNSS